MKYECELNVEDCIYIETFNDMVDITISGDVDEISQFSSVMLNKSKAGKLARELLDFSES